MDEFAFFFDQEQVPDEEAPFVPEIVRRTLPYVRRVRVVRQRRTRYVWRPSRQAIAPIRAGAA